MVTPLEWVLFVWGISFLVAAIVFVIATLILIPILNRRFDPDWKGRYHVLTREGLPFFGVMRTIHYAGAVMSRSLAWRIFRTREYDFRGQVGRFVYSLCVIQQFALSYGLVSLVVGIIGFLVFKAFGISIP